MEALDFYLKLLIERMPQALLALSLEEFSQVQELLRAGLPLIHLSLELLEGFLKSFAFSPCIQAPRGECVELMGGSKHLLGKFENVCRKSQQRIVVKC